VLGTVEANRTKIGENVAFERLEKTKLEGHGDSMGEKIAEKKRETLEKNRENGDWLKGNSPEAVTRKWEKRRWGGCMRTAGIEK